MTMARHNSWTAKAAFSLIELLVVIGIMAVLMAILLPALEKAREQANKTRCATHLQQLGQSLSLYSNENHGDYPRTTYVPGAPLAQGTNPAAPDPFRAGGPVPNDVTAALFLLIRTQGLPPKILTCPYNDVNTFEPDRAQTITGRSNFTDNRKHLASTYTTPNPHPPPSPAAH